MKYLNNIPVKLTAISMLLAASLIVAACVGGTYNFLGRTYQGAILQLTLEDIVLLDEVAYTEEPEATQSLVFQRETAGGSAEALEGTSWTLLSMGDVDDPAEPLANTAVTIEFNEDGQMRGHAGCNNFFSNNYSAGGGQLVTGAVGSTRMACGEPAGIMEQESRFLEQLGASEFYNIEGDTLTLTIPGQVKDYVIRPSEGNQIMAIRARIGNHAATRAQLDIESLPAELRMDTGRYDAINTYETRMPTEGFHANKNVYLPFIRGSEAVERGFELAGWLLFDVPEGAQVESFKWDAGDIIIIDN